MQPLTVSGNIMVFEGTSTVWYHGQACSYLQIERLLPPLR